MTNGTLWSGTMHTYLNLKNGWIKHRNVNSDLKNDISLYKKKYTNKITIGTVFLSRIQAIETRQKRLWNSRNNEKYNKSLLFSDYSLFGSKKYTTF